jgi:hemolysin activation/secretion protein
MTSKVWRSCVLMMAGTAGGANLAQPIAAQVVLPSRQEVTPPTPDARQESAVSVDSSRALEQPACPFETSSLKVTLTTLRFVRPDGSALQPEIAAAIAGIDVPQGEQSISVVCALRDRANAALRRAGWVASVQIPAQEITGGTLQLQVVTARIVEVRVRGSAGPYDSILRERIAQIQALDPLNEKKAERLLLLGSRCSCRCVRRERDRAR